jgi:hypothetical protein
MNKLHRPYNFCERHPVVLYAMSRNWVSHTCLLLYFSSRNCKCFSQKRSGNHQVICLYKRYKYFKIHHLPEPYLQGMIANFFTFLKLIKHFILKNVFLCSVLNSIHL